MATTGKTDLGALVALFGTVAALAVGVAGDLRAAPPLEPLPAPDYSFDLSSPSVGDGTVAAADILFVSYPNPIPALPGATLGLPSLLDDLDALSSGNGPMLPTDEFGLVFSVDRQSVGAAAPDEGMVAAGVPYNVQDQSTRKHPAGDQYLSTDLFTQSGLVSVQDVRANNVLSRNNFDEGGTNFSAYPAAHADTTLPTEPVQDAVDAMARLERRPGDGVIVGAYFSLTEGSPSLEDLSGAVGQSGANVFVAVRNPTFDGACCYPGGTCAITTLDACMGDPNNPGFWLGPDTTCEMCGGGPPVGDGACCYPDGTCAITGDMACFGAGGFWLGPQMTCDQCGAPPTTGTCCLPDGTCQTLSNDDCFVYGGVWVGPGAPCEACGVFGDGACCLPGSQCETRDINACDAAGGWWLGPDTTCDLCGGPPSGACCQPSGSCDIVPDFDCWTAGGFWLGPNTTCDACNMPPIPGACCFGDGGCQILELVPCVNMGGDWAGPNSPCESCALPPGACCHVDGTCQITGFMSCFGPGAHWLGPDTICAECELASGACCLPDGTCLDTDEFHCAGKGGLFTWDGGCLGDGDGNSTDDACEAPGDGLIVGLYASYEDLGLTPGDDIDALIVFDSIPKGAFDSQDRVLFSLAPGSPSLSSIAGVSTSGAAADIFVAEQGQAVAVYAAAADLGLGDPFDNIDALGVHQSSSSPIAGRLVVPDGSGASTHGIRGGTQAIPAVSHWGMVILTLLVLLAATVVLRPAGTRRAL